MSSSTSSGIAPWLPIDGTRRASASVRTSSRSGRARWCQGPTFRWSREGPAIPLFRSQRCPDDRFCSARHLKRISEIGAFDHVALPIENVEQMISFYSALGLLVREDEKKVTVHFGDQKINVHRTSLWQSEAFTLRAAAA